MLSFLLYAILAWFLYNLVFRFIIPIYRATRMMKKKFREMHEHATQQDSDQQSFNQQTTSPRPHGNDYIDFEEIK